MLAALAIGVVPAVASQAGAPDASTAAKKGPIVDLFKNGLVRFPFSGYTWAVRDSPTKVYPGPMQYSGLNVYPDLQGRLHFKVTTNIGGIWTGAEATTVERLGYGKYTWTLDSPINNFDRNVVLGLFSRSTTAKDSAREIDIEVATFGRIEKMPSQYVVQPAGAPGHLTRHPAPQTKSSVLTFDWMPGKVVFASYDQSGKKVAGWTFTGKSVPIEGENNVTINVWTYLGLAPTNNKTQEVIVRSFDFCQRGTVCK